MSLRELPPPPTEKSGWPWAATPDLVADELVGPKISIVIPSFNQGQYLEETLRSILGQNYRNLELLIIDAGSTDQTLAVIKKYQPWISYWVSEPDRGQAQAINKGFIRATGDWVAWLNSDDYYLPGAFGRVLETIQAHPEGDVVSGHKDSFNVDGSFRQTILACEPSFATMLPWQCVYSESSFFHRQRTGNDLTVDESFQHYMDYDLFWRLFLAGKRFVSVPAVLARWRIHPTSKSIRGKDVADTERFRVIWNVLQDSRTPPSEHPALLQHLQSECLNSFGKRRLGRFRSQFLRICQKVGPTRVSARLWARFLLSFLLFWSKPKFIDPGLEDRNIPTYNPLKANS